MDVLGVIASGVLLTAILSFFVVAFIAMCRSAFGKKDR